MKFEFDNFLVLTKRKKEVLKDEILMATQLSGGKPSKYEFVKKTRDFFVFNGLFYVTYENKEKKFSELIYSDIFDFIFFIELLKAFSSNKLDTDKEYKILYNNMAKIVTKKGKVSLEVNFSCLPNKLFFDKFECSYLAAKFGKILQRCEAWQEQEV